MTNSNAHDRAWQEYKWAQDQQLLELTILELETECYLQQLNNDVNKYLLSMGANHNGGF